MVSSSGRPFFKIKATEMQFIDEHHETIMGLIIIGYLIVVLLLLNIAIKLNRK